MKIDWLLKKEQLIKTNFQVFFYISSHDQNYSKLLTYLHRHYLILIPPSWNPWSFCMIHCSKLPFLSFQSFVKMESLSLITFVSCKPTLEKFWHSPLKYSMFALSECNLAVTYPWTPVLKPSSRMLMTKP